MQKAHLNLIRYALDQGCTGSVDGGGDELDLIDGNRYQQIKDDVEAVADPTIIINRDGKQLGWAFIVLEHGQDPTETVCDYSVSNFMETWAAQYYE